jgi:hypothetical protein
LPAARIAPNNPYSTVGFHMMKVLSWSSSVAPPNSTMIAKDSQCVTPARPCFQWIQASWATEAAIATAVAT